MTGGKRDGAPGQPGAAARLTEAAGPPDAADGRATERHRGRSAAWVLERVADAHVTLDRDFRFTDVNAAAERVMGMARREMLGRTHWELFPASADTDAGRAYRRVVAEGVEQHLVQHYVGEGYDRHLEIGAYPTPDGGVAIFWRDVTARVRADLEMRAFRAVLEQSGDAHALFAPDGRIQWANRTMTERLGYTLDEMRGLTVSDINPLFPPEHFSAFFARARHERVPPFEAAHRRKDGSTFPVEITWTVVALPDGPAVFSSVRDITERKAAEREIERLLAAEHHARSDAEAAAAQLSEQALELELSNQDLQDQAAELELQAEELQATAAELEERTQEAEALAASLRFSEAHGRAVFERAGVGMGRVGFCDARWLDVNDAFCRMLGYSREELLATPWPEITHPEDVDLDLVPFRRMAAGELETYAVEKRFVHKAGHHVWARLTLSLVRDAAGRPDYEIAVIEDITARHLADAERERLLAALDTERTRLREVFLQAPVAVAVLRGRVAADLVYELTSPRYLEMLPPGPAALGRRVRDVLPEADAALLGVLQGVLDTGEPFVAADHPVPLDRDGDGVPEDYYFSLVYHPLVEPGGAVGGVVGVGTEVTDSVRARREAEALHRAAEAARVDAEAARVRTEAVLASIADAFYLLDREWRFTYVNAAAEPLLQTTGDRLLGRTLWECFPGVAGSPFEGPYREAMDTGRVTSVEAYFPPLGTWFDVRTYLWAGGLMVHFRDIGARKAAEAERERLLAAAEAARAEAEAASRAKSEFLAVMSHELRTPLNAIGGYAQLMELGLHGPVTPEQAAALDRIQRGQQHLLGLINAVLNYAKIEAGHVAYATADVPVGPALAEVAALMSPQAQTKGLTLSVAPSAPNREGAPLVAHADPEKVRQVLLNLVSNAVKFTRGGGTVTLGAEMTTDGRVALRVSDTGRGIPADQFERVFQPFVQVDASLTRTHEGTGLGLAISRDLARGMGGDLTVESAPGVGSIFTLTLPRA